jgi:hypothetical protein
MSENVRKCPKIPPGMVGQTLQRNKFRSFEYSQLALPSGNRSVNSSPRQGRRKRISSQSAFARFPPPALGRKSLFIFHGLRSIHLLVDVASPVATVRRPFRAESKTEQLLLPNHTLY